MRTLRAIVGERRRIAFTVTSTDGQPVDLSGMTLSGQLGRGSVVLETFDDDDFNKSEASGGRLYLVISFTTEGTWYFTLTIEQGGTLIDRSKHRIIVRPE